MSACVPRKSVPESLLERLGDSACVPRKSVSNHLQERRYDSTCAPASRFPSWIRARLPSGPNYERIKKISASRSLHTVCEEARCPNIGECWNAGTATFMVLGDSCTRGCRFCSVQSALKPPPPDPLEPENLARTISDMNLDYIVLTTVCRDDLPDQGAGHIADCIQELRRHCPRTKIEVLLQDFRGDRDLIARVLGASPDVSAHNIETVRRLTPAIRDAKAHYDQSLSVLSLFRQILPKAPTKSSILLGVGEKEAEVLETLRDLRLAGVQIVTLGQYLRPDSSGRNIPVHEFLPLERFDFYAQAAREMGFLEVASGPLVRSSYRAGELFSASEERRPNHNAIPKDDSARSRFASEERRPDHNAIPKDDSARFCEERRPDRNAIPIGAPARSRFASEERSAA